uniref:Receptor ligand binding region domain-containing protein n=1 Tax=Panagrolaimus sp. JU765 TaxID=591449 RepID=A0AC34RBB1_9BILA
MDGSLGAIPMAIDRIRDEHLLDNFNFSFKIYNDECKESLAAGFTGIMFQEDQVDVVLGPACDSVASIVASFGAFVNKPVMTWGLVSSSNLLDDDKYPTTSVITGTSKALGKALMKVLKQFDWRQFAFLYAVNDGYKRCGYVREDIEEVVGNETDIFISYQRAISETDLETIKSALSPVKLRARIIVTCYESDIDKRTHLIALKELGMNTAEFVTIFLSLRGLGFGTMLTVDYADIREFLTNFLA